MSTFLKMKFPRRFEQWSMHGRTGSSKKKINVWTPKIFATAILSASDVIVLFHRQDFAKEREITKTVQIQTINKIRLIWSDSQSCYWHSTVRRDSITQSMTCIVLRYHVWGHHTHWHTIIRQGTRIVHLAVPRNSLTVHGMLFDSATRLSCSAGSRAPIRFYDSPSDKNACAVRAYHQFPWAVPIFRGRRSID